MFGTISRCLLLCLFSIHNNGEKSGGGADGGVANFRLLLGHTTLRPLHQEKHQGRDLSPSPAPGLARSPPLHKNEQLPGEVRNRGHATATAQSMRNGGEDGKKKRMQLVIVAVAAASAGAALVVLGVAVVLLTCKKLQRSHKGSDQNGTNKVSFDPGPELFYLDTLKPYLEAYDHGRALEKAEPKPEQKWEEDDGACSDDGAESVHSTCCFHSSHFPYSELKAGQTEAVAVSPTGRSRKQSSAPPTPSDKAKASCPSPQCPRTPNNRDRVSRASSPSSAVSNSAARIRLELELPGTGRSFKFLKVQSNTASPVKEAGKATVCSNAAIRKALPPPPPPRPSVPKQQQNVQKSCGPSIPPPPPPRPPGLKHGLSPPPAPPWLLRQNAPVSKDGAPLPKLKPLHWDKVRAAPNRRMVWDRIRSSSFELDEQMIESLFGYNARRSSRHEEVQNRSPSLAKHVMDPKRLQNITILMKALNATTERVYSALLQGNGLSVQQLEALTKMTPTKEEADKFLGYDGDLDSLVPAEELIRAVLTIPCAFARVEAMLYREAFADEVGHIKKSFAMLEDACRELRSSKLFMKLLEAVLKTGNRMNVGTARGGAMAFKLDALLKLADVKGADGKTTLLHFVVQEMTRSHKSPTYTDGADIVTGLSAELTNVKTTASIDLDVLTTSVSGLSHGLSRIKELVGNDLVGDERSECFVTFMAPFVSHAEEVIRELKDGEDRVLGHIRDITEYYHGEAGKDEASPLRIFVIVRDFLGMLERVCREIRGSKSCHGANFVLNV